MMDLRPFGVQFVVSCLPPDLRQLLAGDPSLIVAGGFVRSVIAGERASDVDVFGASVVTVTAAAEKLAKVRCVEAHVTKNALTILSPFRMPIQFVTRWTATDTDALLSEFDFTVAQAAIRCVGGHWVGRCSDDFYPDLAARRLVYTAPARNNDAGGSLLRVRKFLARGYNIQPPSLGGIVAKLVSQIDPERLDLKDEPGMAKVLTGLLREVDPNLTFDVPEPDEVTP